MSMSMARHLLPLTLLLAGWQTAMAASPAWLDASFGDGGVSVVDPNPSSSPPEPLNAYSSIATQDGGVAVVGSVGDRTLELVKLTAQGTIDSNFGNAGRVTVPGVSIWGEGGFCLAEQPDGKIVTGLCMYGSQGASGFVLARLNADGTFDNTFGANGVAFPPFPDRFFSRKIIVQSDGKLLLGATSSVGLRVARLLANGSLDTSYGTQGYAIGSIPIENNHAGQVPDMWQQPDGKILINSISELPSGEQWSITRFLTTGAIDLSFGSNGYVHAPTGTVNGSLADFVLLDDGQMALPNPEGGKTLLYDASGQSAGTSNLPGSYRYALLASGKIVTLEGAVFDPDSGDATTLSSLPVKEPSTVTAEPGGGFLITGVVFLGIGTPEEEAVMQVARYDANGSPVTAFGPGGSTVTQYYDVANASAIQSLKLDDGRVLVLHQPTSGEAIDAAAAQKPGYFFLDSAGLPSTPETVRAGEQVMNLSPWAYIMAASPTLIQFYLTDNPGQGQVMGTLPASFKTECMQDLSNGVIAGGAETVRSNTVAALRTFFWGTPVKLLTLPGYTHTQTLVPDRLGGWYAVVATDANAQAIAHVMADLTLDKSFGNKGLLAMSQGQSLIGRQCVSPLGDGRLAVVTTQGGDPYHSLLLFSAAGRPTTAITLPDFAAGMTQLQSGPDGTLMIAGPTAQGFAVHRLTAQNSLDASFGGEAVNGYGRADNIWSLSRSDAGEWWVTGGTRPDLVTYPFVAKIKPEPLAVSTLNAYDPVELDRSTGLMTQTTRISNNGSQTAPAASLRVTHLPAGVQVWKATQEGKAASWLVPVPAIAAGGSVDVVIKYYIRGRIQMVFQPTLQLVIKS